MKIVVSSTGKNLTDNISDVFGRCPYFIIAEISAKDGNQEIKKFEAIENTSACQTGGAGISAARLVAEKDAKAIITGDIGPRALDVFKQFNIEVYSGNGTVKDVLQEFIDGKLKKIDI